MVPSSSNHVFSPPNSFFNNQNDDDDDAQFNYHHQIHNPFISTVVLQQQQFSELQYSEDHNDLLESVVSSYKNLATSKNDGHSKICTARGVRDRRVRLSIDISRKFFCLQDLLGFDKASKTLDWLLTKSLTSIKDLIEQKSQCSSSTMTDESKARFLETILGDSVVKSVDGSANKSSQRRKPGSQEKFLREQSRVEARARARQRTKEKNLVKKLDDCDQIEQHNGYEDIGWERVMDQETFKQLKDSSFDQIRAFHEQLGD